MSENNFVYIANYLWQKSMENMNQILTEEERNKFNIADYYYLTTIYYMNKPNFGDVAARLGVTKPAISALVRRLEGIGFLEKQQSLEDKRIYYLEVTDKGKRVIEGDNRLYFQFLDLIRSLIEPKQMEQLECLMEQVADTLKNS